MMSRRVRAGWLAGLMGRLLLGGSLFGLVACAPSWQDEGETVRVVGSSTVYPFAVRAAERVDDPTVTIVVEQTGSGGGHKLFCAANSRAHVVMSSRRRLPVEAQDCDRNGRRDTIEIALGFDGIVLAGRSKGKAEAFPTLSRKQLWQALAAELPMGPDCTFKANPHQLWSDIAPTLPSMDIIMHGPPPTSGTRDGFITLVMEKGALMDPCMTALRDKDEMAFRQRAGRLREDGAWIDAGENDTALIQLLQGKPDALGVLGHATVARTESDLLIVPIDGMAPMPRNLETRRYPLLRPLFLYLDKDAQPATTTLVSTMISEEALSDAGYLTRSGLIVLSASEREAERQKLVRPKTESQAP